MKVVIVGCGNIRFMIAGLLIKKTLSCWSIAVGTNI
jgi:hypothetical protein